MERPFTRKDFEHWPAKLAAIFAIAIAGFLFAAFLNMAPDAAIWLVFASVAVVSFCVTIGERTLSERANNILFFTAIGYFGSFLGFVILMGLQFLTGWTLAFW